jgi:hypothetical protein
MKRRIFETLVGVALTLIACNNSESSPDTPTVTAEAPATGASIVEVLTPGQINAELQKMLKIVRERCSIPTQEVIRVCEETATLGRSPTEKGTNLHVNVTTLSGDIVQEITGTVGPNRVIELRVTRTPNYNFTSVLSNGEGAFATIGTDGKVAFEENGYAKGGGLIEATGDRIMNNVTF